MCTTTVVCLDVYHHSGDGPEDTFESLEPTITTHEYLQAVVPTKVCLDVYHHSGDGPKDTLESREPTITTHEYLQAVVLTKVCLDVYHHSGDRPEDTLESLPLLHMNIYKLWYRPRCALMCITTVVMDQRIHLSPYHYYT
ncbi:hypothetical protein J6590_062012 [Homalodisca vitripennis]|nr:hypothetical protein J6590_062012 [Homalodisca vitripennis]